MYPQATLVGLVTSAITAVDSIMKGQIVVAEQDDDRCVHRVSPAANADVYGDTNAEVLELVADLGGLFDQEQSGRPYVATYPCNHLLAAQQSHNMRLAFMPPAEDPNNYCYPLSLLSEEAVGIDDPETTTAELRRYTESTHIICHRHNQPTPPSSSSPGNAELYTSRWHSTDSHQMDQACETLRGLFATTEEEAQVAERGCRQLHNHIQAILFFQSTIQSLNGVAVHGHVYTQSFAREHKRLLLHTNLLGVWHLLLIPLQLAVCS